MKKYRIELTMACLLLVCFYLLSRQAAVISVNQAEQGTQKAAGPLVIVECGFLTNPEEAQKLQTKEYQQKVAGAVTEGIRTYLNVQ